MNEQIEYLFDQALEEFKAENKYATIVVPDSLQRDFVGKFALLIVQECCDIVLAPHNKTGFTISMDLCKFSTRQAIDRAAQSGGLKVHTQGISKEIKQFFIQKL